MSYNPGFPSSLPPCLELLLYSQQVFVCCGLLGECPASASCCCIIIVVINVVFIVVIAVGNIKIMGGEPKFGSFA